MADLNNLLDDINNAGNADENEEQGDLHLEENENPYDDGDRIVDQEGGFLRNMSETHDNNIDFDGDDDNDFTHSQKPHKGAEGGSVDEDEEDGEDEDLEYTELKRLWITEISCPELFPFDSETFDLHKNLVQGQEELVEQLCSKAAISHAKNSDPNSMSHRDSARKKNNKQQVDPNLTSLAASIYRMEADRVRFILSDLARLRLAKIESHPLYMRNMVDRMSPLEVKYLISYGELLEKHLQRTVLNHMPRDSLKKLDEPEMIDSPGLDEYVFCQVMENVIIGSEPSGENEDELDGIGGPQEHEAGASLIARYDLVKDLVLEGKIQLLL